MIEELRSGMNHFRARCSDLEYQNADLRRRLALAERHMADGWPNARGLKRQLRDADHRQAKLLEVVLSAHWIHFPDDVEPDQTTLVIKGDMRPYARKVVHLIPGDKLREHLRAP